MKYGKVTLMGLAVLSMAISSVKVTRAHDSHRPDGNPYVAQRHDIDFVNADAIDTANTPDIGLVNAYTIDGANRHTIDLAIELANTHDIDRPNRSDAFGAQLNNFAQTLNDLDDSNFNDPARTNLNTSARTNPEQSALSGNVNRFRHTSLGVTCLEA